MPYYCRDCKIDATRLAIGKSVVIEKVPEPYRLCNNCLQKRMVVFDKVVELVGDCATPYEGIIVVLEDWAEERKGK